MNDFGDMKLELPYKFLKTGTAFCWHRGEGYCDTCRFGGSSGAFWHVINRRVLVPELPTEFFSSVSGGLFIKNKNKTPKLRTWQHCLPKREATWPQTTRSRNTHANRKLPAAYFKTASDKDDRFLLVLHYAALPWKSVLLHYTETARPVLILKKA